MHRLQEEAAADLARNCSGYSVLNRDVDGFPAETSSDQSEKCVYCNRQGGTPFLMTGDGELHCSRCFEDFTPEEFLAWLQNCPRVAEGMDFGSTERTVQDDAMYLGVKQPARCLRLNAVA
jgi:hypothetical protein